MGKLMVKAATTDVTIIWGHETIGWMMTMTAYNGPGNILHAASIMFHEIWISLDGMNRSHGLTDPSQYRTSTLPYRETISKVNRAIGRKKQENHIMRVQLPNRNLYLSTWRS